MSDKNYTATFLTDQTPHVAFAAINNVRGWWSGEIKGDTDKRGAEFTYRVPGVHYCKMRIAERIPGRKVVWHVLDSNLSYVRVKDEWNDTKITFEISPKDGKTQVRFTHVGLVSAHECYDSCSDAWGTLIKGNLRKLIATGKDQPNVFEANAR